MRYLKLKGGASIETLIYYCPFFIILTSVYSLFFTLFNFKYLFKILAIIILLTASIAAYFMDSYGVMLDQPKMLPRDIYYNLGGLYGQQRMAFHDLMIVFFASVALVFVLLLYLYS